MLLEICANSYQSARYAYKAGAHRIELCQELSVGGITPSYGLIKQVLKDIPIETFVLIRPRSGNFVYSDNEFEIMKQNIQFCKAIGCQGIVSGVLNDDNSIDISRTKKLIELSKPLSFTFHRGFDCTVNPRKTLEQLIDLGADRILTSGQKNKAIEGIELLIELKKQAKNRIKILVGSGVNSENAIRFKNANFDEIHASASKIINIKSSEYFGSTPQTISDIEEIQAILKAIQDAV